MATFGDFLQTLASEPAARHPQFRAFARWFLRTDPESAGRITDIWLWSEFPGRWSVESPIDLVFRQKNGEIWAVLARGLGPDQTVGVADLEAFFQASNRADIQRRLLITSTDRITADAQKLCDKQEKKVLRFMRADFESAAVSFPESIEALHAELLKARQAKASQSLVVERLEKDTKGEAVQTTYKFSDMKLNVGDRLQMQLPAMLGAERPVVRMIGFIPGVSVLVSMPLNSGGKPYELVEGEEVVVRLFSALAVYGFPATVIRVCKGPVPYLHLEFPVEVQGRAIRAERRIRTNVIVSVAIAGSTEEPVSAVVTNLSPTGCMIEGPKRIGERDAAVRISLRLNAHGQEHLLELDGIVRSADAGEEAGIIRHGVKFGELDEHNSLIVHSYIYHQLVEQPGSAA